MSRTLDGGAIVIRYSTGEKEEVRYNGKNRKAIFRVLELAHRIRHWSHGVASIDSGGGIAAEEVYALVSHASVSANPPSSLPVPRETIFQAIRRLCDQPASIAHYQRRGSEKWLRAAVKALHFPDGTRPEVQAVHPHVAGWLSNEKPRVAVQAHHWA